MNTLISVSNKSRLIPLSKAIVRNPRAKILATSGSYNYLYGSVPREQLIRVSDYTGYPELLGGKVKTLHPKIFAGILAKGPVDPDDRISLVVANLYPFRGLADIDVGGSALIRAAVKAQRCVVTDPADYDSVIDNLDRLDCVDFSKKAIQHVLEHDAQIARYLDIPLRVYTHAHDLRYGLNPTQSGANIYTIDGKECPIDILHGSPSYINILDAMLGYQLTTDITSNMGHCAAASYKHNSPAGVARASTPLEAVRQAKNCDPQSSYGDFVAVSGIIDEPVAKFLRGRVSDGIIAPEYTPDALEILRQKKGGKFIILQMPYDYTNKAHVEYREIAGLAISQQPNNCNPKLWSYKVVCGVDPPADVWLNMIIANNTLKYTQSNAVAIAYDNNVIGIGAGQQNRVGCVELAGIKAEKWVIANSAAAQKMFQELRGAGFDSKLCYTMIQSEFNRRHVDLPPLILCSDGFFPFPDSIDVAYDYGVRYICQPGGSKNDETVIKRCQELGISMIFTGQRLFTH